jgi:hypothetical protein
VTRPAFTADEWAQIVAILRLQPEEEPRARRTLAQMRLYAQERAGIAVDRKRKAAADLQAASDALAALAGALARFEIDADPGAMPLALYRLAQAGMLPEEVRRIGRDAARLRLLIGKARAGLAVPEGRPSKARDQATVIRNLAHYFTRRTHRPATSTKSGPFVEFVRVVLGLGGGGEDADAGRAAELVRASLKAAKPAKAAKARASTRAARG